MSKSKVKEYIAQVKRSDKSAAVAAGRQLTNSKLGTLEDLYGIDDLASQTSSTAKTELRKTLRELKEKDVLILKLREACHALTLKYADAENTIDQLRFGSISRSGSVKTNLGYYGHGRNAGTATATAAGAVGPLLVKSASAFCLAGAGTTSAIAAAAATGTAPATTKKIVEQRDQSTAMSPIPEPLKSFLQTTNDEYNNSWSSHDVLDESCSNWMEKVQNWKTADSLFNTSADADSGFRGSEVNTNTVAVGTSGDTLATAAAAAGTGAGGGPCHSNSTTIHPLVENVPVPTQAPTNTNTNSSSGSRNNFGINSYTQIKNLASHGHRLAGAGTAGLSPISAFSMHKNKTAVATITRGTNTADLDTVDGRKPNAEEVKQQQKQSRSSQCESFDQFPEPAEPSTSTSQYRRRMKSQSFDNLRVAINQEHDESGELLQQPNSKDFIPHYIRRLSNSNIRTAAGGKYYSESTTYFKSLDPLLDDATRLAKRVQYKSQRLARQLEQTLNESRNKRK